MARKPALSVSARGSAVGALSALLLAGAFPSAASAASTASHAFGAALPLAAVMVAGQCESVPVAAISGSAPASKASLIIGGQPSALEALIARQSGNAPGDKIAVTARPNPSAGFARLVCAEQPSGYNSLFPSVATGIGRTTSRDFGNVFDFIALRVSATPFDSDWSRVSNGSGQSVALAAATLARPDSAAVERRALIERVNRWVNARIRFAPDTSTYGRRDHWADANETLARRVGDCEDYAIAKMQILKAAGVPEDDLQLVVVRDLVRRADHAVLVARVDGALLLLDNNTDIVTDASRAQDYVPIFSYSAGRKWVHGRRYQPSAPEGTFRFASAAR